MAAVHLTDHCVAQQPSLGAIELQPPLCGVIRNIEVGLHRADRAVFQAHQYRGDVLHLVMEGLSVVHGGHLHHPAARDIADQIDAVHAHIHQRAAAGMLLLLPPCAGNIRIPAGKLRVARHQLTDLARIDRLLHRLHISAVAHHEAGGEQHTLVPAVIHYFLRLSGSHGQRLFQQDMLAPIRRKPSLTGMEHHRRGDIYGVDFRIIQQRLIAGVGTLCVVLCAQLFRQFLVDFHHRDQFRVFCQHHTRQRAPVCNAARAQYTPTYLFHR